MLEELKTHKSNLPGWQVAQDVKKLNAKHIGNFTQGQIKTSKVFHERVRSTFIRSKVYLNYRENFIAIKVHEPKMADKLTHEYTDLIDYCEQNKIKAVKSPSGIIFRLE